jgi:peptide/nickel transport system substrate-binding protein
MLRRKIFVALSMALIAAILLTACSTASSPSTSATAKTAPSAPAATLTPRNGGTFKILAVTGPSAPFGWPPEALGASTPSVRACLDPLVNEDLSGRDIPCLAESWQVAPDGKSLTFYLRKGVKFHDGTDWNAQAAKFNIDAFMVAKKPGTNQFTSVDILDDYTVKVNLKQYQNSILGSMAVSDVFVSPTAYNTKGLDWVRYNPVGTGPFKFVSFARDVSLKFSRFDGYWQKGLPYLDAVEYAVIQDPMTRAATFQTGDGNVISSADARTASDLAAKGYEVISQANGYAVLLPDSANPNSPFAKQKVREAVEYAIDKAAIAKALGFGYWSPNYQATIPTGMAFNSDIIGRKYDVAKAKQLLTEAGYPVGFDTTIIPDPQTYNKDAVQSVQSYLKEIGINAQVNIVDAAKYSDIRTKGWSNAMVYCMYAESPNYDATMDAYISANSIQFNSVKRPEGYQDTLNSALVATDYNVQKSLCQKMVKILYDDDTIIPLYTGATLDVLSKGLHGHGLLTSGHFTIWTPEKTWMEQ